jgi:hypothetical protein
MRLFKYFSAEGATRLFKTGMLRFTQPIEFNDAFEMQPFLAGLAEEPSLDRQFDERLGALVDSEIDKCLATLPPKKRAAINRDWLRAELLRQAPDALGLVKQLATIATPFISKEIYKGVNENFGALCLTEKPANLLMWAHYADHHKGAVVEFAADHQFFSRRLGPNDDFRHFRKVVYREQRPAVFLSNSDAIEFFYFKSREWSYENEWRLIVPLADCSQRVERAPECPICLFHLPPASVRSMILGCRMPESNKYELAKLLRSNLDFHHVVLEQAYPDERLFKIQRRSVDHENIDRWLSLPRPGI